MGAIGPQITSLTIVYLTVYSGAHQSKHQSSASLAFVWGIHRWPVNSPHKWQVTRKMFPFDDVIMRFPGEVMHIIRCLFVIGSIFRKIDLCTSALLCIKYCSWLLWCHITAQKRLRIDCFVNSLLRLTSITKIKSHITSFAKWIQSSPVYSPARANDVKCLSMP